MIRKIVVGFLYLVLGFLILYYLLVFSYFVIKYYPHSQLGYMYLNGIILPHSDKTAVNHFKKAIKYSKDINSYYNLGICFMQGIGVVQNTDSAIFYYKKVVDSNIDFNDDVKARAGYKLALIYYFGWGGKHDYYQAAEYANYGAIKNYKPAYNLLGNLYFDGLGVEQNDSLAFVNYSKADENGNIANCYQNGIYVEKNDSIAIEYLKKEEKSAYCAAKLSIIYKKQGNDSLASYYNKKRLECLCADTSEFYVQKNNIGFAKYTMFTRKIKRKQTIFDRTMYYINLADYYLGNTFNQRDSAKALELLTMAYKCGYLGVAANKLGNFYYNKKDYKNAVMWYKKGGNNLDAMCSLAYCYDKGLGEISDSKNAFRLWSIAASKGEVTSMHNVAVCYEDDGDIKNAVKFYVNAQNHGYDEDNLKIGKFYNKIKDYNSALKYLDKAEKEGEKDAYFYKAYCNYELKNYNLAEKYYLLDIKESDDVSAHWNLGLLYENENSGLKNDSLAFYHIKYAAENGEEKAQFELAEMYSEGLFVKKNLTEAIKWYKKAAENDSDNGKSAYNLAKIYAKKNNYLQAAKYYKQAAEKNIEDAAYQLAELYANGKGVKANINEAIKWYEKAEEKGNSDARYKLGLWYYGKQVGIFTNDEPESEAAYGYFIGLDHEKYEDVEEYVSEVEMMYEYNRYAMETFFYEQTQSLVEAAVDRLKNCKKQYLDSAKHGDVNAQLKIADAYLKCLVEYCDEEIERYVELEENFVVNNALEALYWYNLAAKNGSKKALNGVLKCNYLLGNEFEVEKLVRKSAEKGNVKAQIKMGEYYENGGLMNKNYFTAFQWYLKAAKQGNKEAQEKIGKFYAQGKGVAKDTTKAQEWLKKLGKDIKYYNPERNYYDDFYDDFYDRTNSYFFDGSYLFGEYGGIRNAYNLAEFDFY